MSNESYTKRVEYDFVVDGEAFAVGPIKTGNNGSRYAYIEETRKNGQEDTHMSGYLVLTNGAWEWHEDEGSDQFDSYLGEVYSQAILDYLNEHPHPELCETTDAD